MIEAATQVPYNMGSEFNVQCPAEATYFGYKPGLADVPEIKPYVFQIPRLRDLMAFWGSQEVALKIKGDPATGKTSLVQQFHARMRAPLLHLSCSEAVEPYHFFGQYIPTESGSLKWVDGPVLKAARYGWSVLLDEYNTLNPNASTSLNALLEGYPITIPETGETVVPHKWFRVFATENPVNSTLTVTGRNVQDVANDDRWMVMHVDYLTPDEEVPIVERVAFEALQNKEAAHQAATIMVATANEVRKACRERSRIIDKPMSTRVLVRWARLLRMYSKVVRDDAGNQTIPLVYSLQRAFSVSSDEMGAEVMRLAKVSAGVE